MRFLLAIPTEGKLFAVLVQWTIATIALQTPVAVRTRVAQTARVLMRSLCADGKSSASRVLVNARYSSWSAQARDDQGRHCLFVDKDRPASVFGTPRKSWAGPPRQPRKSSSKIAASVCQRVGAEAMVSVFGLGLAAAAEIGACSLGGAQRC